MSEYTQSRGQRGSESGRATYPPPHSYPLAVRDYGFITALGLLMESLPYALARLGVDLAFAVGGIVWLVITFGGAAWLGAHVAQVFGVVWFIGCIVGVGWFWGAVLRYLLHLIECGHVAVLTELITRGRVGNGDESMFAYGRRVMLERFGQVNALFALNALVRGVLQAFHRTLDWVAEMVPIPGLDSVSSLINIILRAATRYVDKVILSYSLARGGDDAWSDAREGIIYYCQNAKPILKTSIWIVILERVLSVLVWILLMVPAAGLTVLLPHAVRETGGLITVIIAIMLAAAVRNAFVKPVFLIMMMIRFHTLIEGQPIDASWNDYLASISDKFRDLGRRVSPARA
jgi:hypothetical protein